MKKIKPLYETYNKKLKLQLQQIKLIQIFAQRIVEDPKIFATNHELIPLCPILVGSIAFQKCFF